MSLAGVLEGTIISVVSLLLHAGVAFVTHLLSGSLFDPYTLTTQAVADAMRVRYLAFLIVGVSVAWIGLRAQVSPALRLAGGGADFERLVLAIFMVAGSLWFCQELLAVNNAIVGDFVNASMYGGGAVASIGASLAGLAALIVAAGAGVGAAFSVALFTGLAALALIALVVVVFVLYVIRSAEIVFFTATMPIWSALYAFPETGNVLGAAYVELAVSIFQQALGVITWWLATTLILNTAAGTDWVQAVANMFSVVGVLFLLVKIPGVLRRLLAAGGGSRGFVSTLAETTTVASRMPGLAARVSRYAWIP